jgi:hypothetical protein
MGVRDLGGAVENRSSILHQTSDLVGPVLRAPDTSKKTIATSRATKGRSHSSGPGDGLEAYERGNEDEVEDHEAVRAGRLERVRVDDANTPINARRLLKQSRNRRAGRARHVEGGPGAGESRAAQTRFRSIA